MTIHQITFENVDQLFDYIKPDASQAARYDILKMGALALIKDILLNVPDCADRTHAIRQIRDGVLWANKAISVENLE